MQVEVTHVERRGAERLKGFTVAVSVVVMVWIVLGMLHQLGLFVLVDGQGPFANAGWSPFGAWEAFVLSAVISVTVLWAKPRRASALLLAAIVVAAVGVLLQFGSLIVSTMNMFDGMSEPGFALLELFRIVLNLVLPVLALVWLLALRGDSAATVEPPVQQRSIGPAPAWQPEQARGAHWPTASGAASGSAASDWGTPGQPGGWGPPAQQPRGPEQFGPQALAEQYGRPAEGDEQTRAVPTGRREPPQWTPLDDDPRK